MRVDTVAAICNSYPDVERTVEHLQAAEANLERLSTIGLASSNPAEIVGFYRSDGKTEAWGDGQVINMERLGSCKSLGLFVLPGLGPVLASGPFLKALIDVVEGRLTVGSVSTFGAGLITMGIARPRVLRYESAMKAKECMLLYHAPAEDTARVKALLQECPFSKFVD